MRTETITTTYEIYKFNELSDDAKERVKQWYLDGQENMTFIFTEDCIEDLHNLFGDNSLEVQYSLASCQGDGFNIYGSIEAWKIFNCLDKHNGGTQLEKFENVLTDEEKKIILNYAEQCKDIELPYNRRYCYSLADYIDIVDEWEWYLEEDYDKELLKRFENMVREIFSTLCRSYEKQGYQFFYEISMEDLEECCEANEWEFLEDGTLYS